MRRDPDPDPPAYRPRSAYYLDYRDAAGPNHPARRKALAAMRELLANSTPHTKETLVERYLRSHADAGDVAIEAIFGRRGVVIAQGIRAQSAPVFYPPPEPEPAADLFAQDVGF